jgi:hypothetical protein
MSEFEDTDWIIMDGRSYFVAGYASNGVPFGRFEDEMWADVAVAPSRREDGHMDDFRFERDTMGEVKVPAGALWRAQTQRAVENFPVSGRGLEPAQIRALARI